LAGLFFLEKKAIGRRVLSLLYWESTPLTVYPEESVLTTIFLSGSYYTRTRALISRVFNYWNTSLYYSDQAKGISFLVSTIRGIVIVEKPRTNSR
jgi:hypothetical protein